jgi:hypothetical protein
MERGIKLGGVVGVISVIIGFIQPVITEGSIQYLTFIISNPTIILTSLVWNVAIFALLGAIYERQGGLSGNSQGGATQPSEFESSMSEFEE